MRLGIIGPADYMPIERIWSVMCLLPKDTIIVTSPRRGTGMLVKTAARDLGLATTTPSSWDVVMVNGEMNKAVINNVEKIIIFHDGTSPTLVDAIAFACSKGIPMEVFPAE